MNVGSLFRKGVWALKHPKKILSILRREISRDGSLTRNLRIIRESAYFDADWYLANNFDVQQQGHDPALHYLIYGGREGRDPSPRFCSEEYLSLNADVARAGVNPLLHYETFGKNEGRPVSWAEAEREPVFPDGTAELRRDFSRAPVQHRRTAVVACYLPDGKLPDTLLYLLRGLRGVADNIVLAGDCPVFPGALDALEGLACCADFRRAGQYDFGSWKRGLADARADGLLDAETADELIFINDSCYGPVYPFAESFDAMKGRDCDFWGYSGYRDQGPERLSYISSYFAVFRRKVLDSRALDEFLDRLQGSGDRGMIVASMETEMTGFLASRGFSWDTFCSPKACRMSLFYRPLSFLRLRHPLLKKKAFERRPEEDLGQVMALVRENAPELAAMIRPEPRRERAELPSLEAHRAAFPAVCARIADKVRAGGQVRAVFFVPSASMFPSRPLYEAMLRDARFDPRIAVIPDTRWARPPQDDMERCREELLREGIDPGRITVAAQDGIGRWKNLLDGADVACYNTPYRIGSSRYVPRAALGRSVLPVMVNYGFYRSKYDDKLDGLDSYTWLWKAFFECPDSLAQYKRNSPIGGVNGELTGYVKMDALARAEAEPHDRPRILVALHHSVEGGANDHLALANILRYSGFFLRLPERYPDIDFVFRPHPYLFRVLRQANFWGDEKTDAYIAALRAHPNVIWCEGGDYFPAFAASDGCIQDCGSYLVEYFYTGKPCCYMLKSPADIEAKFAPLGQKCLAQCYIAYDQDAIERFIREVIAGGRDEKAAGRAALAKEIMVNYPHAAEAALASICRGIFGGE